MERDNAQTACALSMNRQGIGNSVRFGDRHARSQRPGPGELAGAIGMLGHFAPCFVFILGDCDAGIGFKGP